MSSHQECDGCGAIGSQEHAPSCIGGQTLAVPLKVPMTIIRNTLCNGFEGGIGYWARIDGYDYGLYKAEDFKEGGMFNNGLYFHPSQLVPLQVGCAVHLYEFENKVEDQQRLKLDLSSIKRGLEVMSMKYPRHFADMVAETGDATTGDVFIQCCLLGEIVYG
jgi:hypothetical protein